MLRRLRFFHFFLELVWSLLGVSMVYWDGCRADAFAESVPAFASLGAAASFGETFAYRQELWFVEAWKCMIQQTFAPATWSFSPQPLAPNIDGSKNQDPITAIKCCFCLMFESFMVGLPNSLFSDSMVVAYRCGWCLKDYHDYGIETQHGRVVLGINYPSGCWGDVGAFVSSWRSGANIFVFVVVVVPGGGDIYIYMFAFETATRVLMDVLGP